MQGHEVISKLATHFPQLMVAPGEDAEPAWRQAALRGTPPEGANLSHFTTTSEDWLRICETPATSVDAIFLANRDDFENTLRCLTHRCRPDVISPTIGAMTISGLADWQILHDEQMRLLQEDFDNFGDRFKEFIADRTNYTVTIVLISEGPYSAISAQDAGFPQQDWLRLSREIRLYHELAHVTCRALMPNDTPPIWDELTADFHGLIRALGTYDTTLALRFLGIVDGSYQGGRLWEYLTDEQRANIDKISAEVIAACEGIERTTQNVTIEHSYDALLELKRNPLLSY